MLQHPSLLKQKQPIFYKTIGMAHKRACKQGRNDRLKKANIKAMPHPYILHFPHITVYTVHISETASPGRRVSDTINMSSCPHNQTMFLSLLQQLKINFQTQLDKTWFSLELINTQDSKYQYMLYQPRSMECGSRKVSQHFTLATGVIKSLMSSVTVSLPTCRMVIFAAKSSGCDWCNFLCNWSYFLCNWSCILDCSGSSGVQSS